MTGTMPKAGDKVRVTYEGEVVYVSGSYFEMQDDTRHCFKGAFVEILQKPLVVGDEVTPENAHLLPETFILADKDGGGWESQPAPEMFPEYAPYKLVYIHGEEK